MVKNLPCNAGDVVMVPGRETKIPHTVEQLNPCITTKTPCNQINILKNKLIKDQLSGYELTGFPSGSVGKESACNAEDLGLIPGLERSPGGGHGNHSSILAWRIPTERGAWRFTVHRFAKSQI